MTSLDIADLETRYLQELFKRDAQIWAQRIHKANSVGGGPLSQQEERRKPEFDPKPERLVYDGYSPCRKCGAYQKFVKSKRCVNCARAGVARDRRNLRRREERARAAARKVSRAAAARRQYHQHKRRGPTRRREEIATRRSPHAKAS